MGYNLDKIKEIAKPRSKEAIDKFNKRYLRRHNKKENDMTQDKKELLLKDLCARLPYGVIVEATYKDGEGWKTEDRKFKGLYNDGQVYVDAVYTNIENVNPYLRPMSSMTDEEKKELKADTCPEGTGYFDENYLICPMSHYGEQISYDFMSVILEWLNSRHFDYRGLIEKGLALEAPEGMYK